MSTGLIRWIVNKGKRAVKTETCVITLFAAFLLGCSSQKSLTEQQISAAIDAIAINPNASTLNLQPYLKSKITKLCIQTPYFPQDQFEKRAGEDLDDFEFVDDQYNVLWVFSEKLEPLTIKLDRYNQINVNSQNPVCGTSSVLTISHEMDRDFQKPTIVIGNR